MICDHLIMSCDYITCVYKVSISAATQDVPVGLIEASRHQYSTSNDISQESLILEMQ